MGHEVYVPNGAGVMADNDSVMSDDGESEE
jgi:hypothetical protein